MADNHNNNNANNNGPPHPPQPQFPPLLQIQDIDSWLRFNGLRSADDNATDDWSPPEYAGFLSHLNRRETLAKHDAENEYQQAIHRELFRDALQVEHDEEQQRKRLLGTWEEDVLVISSCYIYHDECDDTVDDNLAIGGGEECHISDNHQHFRDRKTKAPNMAVWKVPLVPLAATCDTIFTLAASRQRFASISRATPPQRSRCGGAATTFDGSHFATATPLQLSLDEFPAPAIQEFLDLILHKKTLHQLEADHVVHVCQLAHFLQCPHVVHATADILYDHVDSENCLSLCQLADRLELSDLFERALFHMLKRLDDVEAHEAYETFSPELKTRIAGIRSVFTNSATTTIPPPEPQQQSSTPSKQRPLFFTSLQEYVAIFAENVQYHRERLEEAKAENDRRFSSYAQSKIDKQEVRVLTLEAMLQEQKRLFGGNQQQPQTRQHQQQQRQQQCHHQHDE